MWYSISSYLISCAINIKLIDMWEYNYETKIKQYCLQDDTEKIKKLPSILPFLSIFTWFLLLYYYIKLHSLVKKRKAFIEKLSVPIIRRMLFSRALKEKKIYKKYYNLLTTQEKHYYDRVWSYCFGR